MALTFSEAQEALIDRLKASAIPNVFEANVPAGFILPQQNNAHLPYACISFGGNAPIAMRNTGITSSKYDMKRTSVAVECIGDSPRDVRRVTQIVRDQFEGFEVDESWSQLIETLAGDYTMYLPDYALWPVRYATGIHFSAMTNGITFQ